MNLAYHLNKLGAEVQLISAVGDDMLGRELLRRIGGWGVGVDAVHQDPQHETGTVQVTLRDGIPSYQIVENVAWDYIPLPSFGTTLSRPVIVFGSLALRSSQNRETLESLLSMYPDAYTVFDINLRKPYVDLDYIASLASRASLIKVNDEELELLLGTGVSRTPSQLADAARALASKYGCARICVTAGAHGAGLLDEDDWHWAAAAPVTVRDTIGAGDSFLSAVVFGLLFTDQTHEQTLALANRLAGVVASSDGATPDWTVGSDGMPVATGI